VISRRKLLSMLAAGAIAAPGLLIPRKTIFLPPIGGWPQVAIASFSIPKWLIDGYADGLAKGHFSYDEATETMSLLKHDPERAQVDGKFHSPGGRVYDWEDVAHNGGKRAEIDDAMDATKQNLEAAALHRAEQLKIYADPAMSLPHVRDINDITWEYFPTSPQERVVMDALRQDAISKGLPIIPGTYCLDDNKLYDHPHFIDLMARRSRLWT
jgi:hypothetical protein